MQLRRALLLFAVVLGLAALAASVAPPPDKERDRTATEAVPSPRPQAQPAEIRFESGVERPPRRRLAAGSPATVRVNVDVPGQVEIPGLGLIQSAEPGTPALFDVLVPEAGRYEVVYTPLDGRPRRIGVIDVRG